MQLTRPGEAASSQVRCSGLGISWLALTIATSARPPKLVSKPQIRCEGSSIVSLWPSGSLELDGEAVRDDRGRPGFHLVTPGRWPGRRRTGRSRRCGSRGCARAPSGGLAAVALQEAEGRDRLEDRGPHGVVVDGARPSPRRRPRPGRARGAVRRRRAATCAGPSPWRGGPRTCLPRPCGPSPPGRTRAGRGWRSPPALRVAGEDGVEDVLHGSVLLGRGCGG